MERLNASYFTNAAMQGRIAYHVHLFSHDLVSRLRPSNSSAFSFRGGDRAPSRPAHPETKLLSNFKLCHDVILDDGTRPSDCSAAALPAVIALVS